MATRTRNGNGHGHDVQARLDALRADFDALQRDMRGLVNDATGEYVGGAVHSAQDALDRAGQWGNQNLEDVRHAVRAQPLASCVLSMSAGALIGALLLRR